MIEGLACAWPTGSAGSRESPADAGVPRWTDRAGQQAAPAWSEHGLTPEYRAMNTTMAAAGWSPDGSADMRDTRPRWGVHVGGGIDPVSPHCSMCYSADVDLQQRDGPYAF